LRTKEGKTMRRRSKGKPLSSYPEIMTVAETAEVLRVRPVTIYRCLRDGDLKGMKMRGHWRVRRSTIEDLFKA
jgi:excisionase family DNA binding protein